MNYKIDVSLSTNEVYTLTFDYTFDESVEDKTIRLQIGDLTIETQDRRVVFKTTSSATCIKSNVRLENVNLYEGNFLDYDQHGEYTKESYLKGRTLINNVMPSHTFPQTANGRIDFSGNFKQNTTYTVIYHVTVTTPHETPASGFVDRGGSGGWASAQIWYDANGGQLISTFTTGTGELPFTFRIYANGVVDYLMIIEGDYTEEANNNLIHPFMGIGCVKSPFITSIGNEQGFGKGGRL